MYSAILPKVAALKSRIPLLKGLRLNFILIHYIYIIAMSLITSIIIYPGSELDYIDALFFCAGAATQSGLNPVDVNKLRTYQQVILYSSSMLTTPIFIHSVLVFIRLYWFEKRFQHIVQDARALRQTRTRNRTISQDKDTGSLSREEAGIGGRPIVVLRNNVQDFAHRDQESAVPTPRDSSPGSPSQADSASSLENQNNRLGLGLGLGSLRVPTQLDPEHHIAFLEQQRKNKGALRIPSPREYDRGGVPEVLEEADEGNEDKQAPSIDSDDSARSMEDSDQVGPLDGPHITINEPDMQRTKTRNSTFPQLDTRPTFRETKDLEDTSPLGRTGTRRPTFSNIVRSLTQERERTTLPYLSWNATVARNSNFVDLTEEQRDELGGIEYRALKTLAIVLISYYLFFHIFGIISLVGWIMTTHWGTVVEEIGQGRPWWGIFTAGSAFNDVGFTLTPDSMSSFQTAVFPLLLMTFLIIIGNTGFPCMLRLIIWALSKVVRRETAIWEELKFLLDHPRRCFTLLFPRNATWWLFAILIALNGIDLIFFIILDLNDPTVTALSPGIRVLDGLFQAASTRTAGFGVVNVANLHPAIQVSYMIMMYISVFPIAISMRRTNVYEERSLGIYAGGDEDDSSDTHSPPSYIGFHLRRQLSFDLWYVFLGLFIIAIVEGPRLQAVNEYAFQMWAVLFEIVSAYGTVGLSLGYPGVNTSFSGQFKVISKLVIIAMQVRGRHRGLPYALDRAILLPSESLQDKEIADAEKRMRRRSSNLSTMSDMNRTFSQSRAENGVSTGLENKDKDKDKGRNSHSWMNGDNIIRRHSTLRSSRSQR
ncbi:potassium ion transporter [Aspergillus clavatus NRRL 1]|uniref:Potassium transport protein n=1 Tax=Aspergillus clavatus (strain ATCC 1007 / CBS 513.65 / DSM 816 / NCTC 3887 / NRRL 1 / QM 1276 / 107) TaxID=344612 RepID=A1C5B7_ASPCL|nr:potassium ion transporter (Trk1), putative [Aspergillus clavatus NRRL 1]EAW14885.1 potassium ion transporter (Trk1), putative [Aspergillus clavatus NRRL 1]